MMMVYYGECVVIYYLQYVDIEYYPNFTA